LTKKIDALKGVKESDTGLSPPSQWDLVSDRQMMQGEQPLQVARCTKIINPNTEDAQYMINVKQIAKYVVGLGDKVSPTDIEEGMRVGWVEFSRASSVWACLHQRFIACNSRFLQTESTARTSTRSTFLCLPKSTLLSR